MVEGLVLNMEVEDLKALIEMTVKKVLKTTPPLPPKLEPYHDWPELLSRRQAAKLLGVSLNTIDNWTREGLLQRYTNGKSPRFKKSELLKSFRDPLTTFSTQ